MLKELDSVVNAVKKNHPNVYKALGDEVREKTLEVYFGGNLRGKGKVTGYFCTEKTSSKERRAQR